ncbi:MAG: hypothetical protein GX660_19125 [Clostridiaceae bacterium]|nr:hypothetical protein [Clostridiaceae bacterium]
MRSTWFAERAALMMKNMRAILTQRENDEKSVPAKLVGKLLGCKPAGFQFDIFTGKCRYICENFACPWCHYRNVVKSIYKLNFSISKITAFTANVTSFEAEDADNYLKAAENEIKYEHKQFFKNSPVVVRRSRIRHTTNQIPLWFGTLSVIIPEYIVVKSKFNVFHANSTYAAKNLLAKLFQYTPIWASDCADDFVVTSQYNYRRKSFNYWNCHEKY